MNRFIISRARPTESVPRHYMENRTASEIFSEYVESVSYEIDEDILITDNEAEAREKFAAMRSDINFSQTPAGYEIRYDIYEFGYETGYYESDGEWYSEEYHKIQTAPLVL